LCMRDPDTAAHTLGKLIKHCGESNVLWGTPRYNMATTCRVSQKLH
jgi:hypothetical protein